MEKILNRIVEKIKSMSQKKYKQVILVRKDLNLPKGKMAAQVAHASVDAVLKSSKETIDIWKKQGMKKIVLGVSNEDDLEKYKKGAEERSLTAVIITDAGHTVLKPGTKTCVAIGPDLERKIDSITGDLSTI